MQSSGRELICLDRLVDQLGIPSTLGPARGALRVLLFDEAGLINARGQATEGKNDATHGLRGPIHHAMQVTLRNKSSSYKYSQYPRLPLSQNRLREPPTETPDRLITQ